MEYDVQREQMGLCRHRQPSDSSWCHAIKFHLLNFPTRPGWHVSDWATLIPPGKLKFSLSFLFILPCTSQGWFNSMRAWLGAGAGLVPVRLRRTAKPSVEVCCVDGGSVGFAYRSVLACLGAEGKNSCCVWGWWGALLPGLLQRWEVLPKEHLYQLVLWELRALG